METRTIEIDDQLIDLIKEALRDSILDYAKGRKKDVARGLESEALAGLLIEKYGYGVNDAVKTLFDVMSLPGIDLTNTVNAAQEDIDPNAKANRKLRFEARPATITPCCTQ